MSTQTYAEKQIAAIQAQLDELKNSLKIHDGFIAFNPTEEDKCP